MTEDPTLPGIVGGGVNHFLGALTSKKKRPLVIAHRGASAFAPENTLEAARLGLARGADGWELDVRLTRDGVPVVIHDASLRRTTDVAARFRDDPRALAGYLVADFDEREIRTLDAGSWFVAEEPVPRSSAWFGTREALSEQEGALYSSGRVRIPTLRECLEWTDGQEWLVNVEIKSWPGFAPGLVAGVMAEVQSFRIAQRVLVSSFDHDGVARVARSPLPIATGVLTMQPLFQPARYVRESVGARCYHPSAEAIGAESNLAGPDGGAGAGPLRLRDLESLQREGVPVLCYTVNDSRPEGQADRLAQAGVDALFTDDPAGLLQLFGSPTNDRSRDGSRPNSRPP